jgi:hypothetical protein
LVTKVLGCCENAGRPAEEEQLLPGRPGRPTVEGTPGAVELVHFREGTGEAALQGEPRESVVSRAGWFERGRNRTVAERRNLSSDARHRLRDRGCPGRSGWGKSVGRAVVTTGGCQRESGTRPLACENLASGGPKGRSLLVARWLAIATKRRASGGLVACSWVSHLQKSVGGMWPEHSGE